LALSETREEKLNFMWNNNTTNDITFAGRNFIGTHEEQLSTPPPSHAQNGQNGHAHRLHALLSRKEKGKRRKGRTRRGTDRSGSDGSKE